VTWRAICGGPWGEDGRSVASAVNAASWMPMAGGVVEIKHSTDVVFRRTSSARLHKHSPGRKVMLRSRFECLFSMTLLRGVLRRRGRGGQGRAWQKLLRMSSNTFANPRFLSGMPPPDVLSVFCRALGQDHVPRGVGVQRRGQQPGKGGIENKHSTDVESRRISSSSSASIYEVLHSP